MKRAIICGCLAAFLTACHSARRGEPTTGLVPLGTQKLAHGQVLFMRHCQQCHPGGNAGLGPALNNKSLAGWLIKTQVRVGLGSMPGFTIQDIRPADLDDLVAYVKALRHADVAQR